jgi:hypothetical protein
LTIPDLDRQEENLNLVAKEEILHEIENQLRTSTWWQINWELLSCNLVYPKGARFTSISHPKSSGTKTRQFNLPLMFNFMLLLTITVFYLVV